MDELQKQGSTVLSDPILDHTDLSGIRVRVYPSKLSGQVLITISDGGWNLSAVHVLVEALTQALAEISPN